MTPRPDAKVNPYNVGHGWWIELWITEDPTPLPHDEFDNVFTVPRRGIGFLFRFGVELFDRGGADGVIGGVAGEGVEEGGVDERADGAEVGAVGGVGAGFGGPGGVGIGFEPCREVGGLGGDGGGIGDLARGLGVGSGVVLRGWEASVERGREG